MAGKTPQLWRPFSDGWIGRLALTALSAPARQVGKCRGLCEAQQTIKYIGSVIRPDEVVGEGRRVNGPPRSEAKTKGEAVA